MGKNREEKLHLFWYHYIDRDRDIDRHATFTETETEINRILQRSVVTFIYNFIMDRFSLARVQNTRNVVQNYQRYQGLNREINGLRLQPQIRQNHLRDMVNPLEAYSDIQFQQNFAFTKPTFNMIFDIFKDELASLKTRSDDFYLPPVLKLIIFLQYLRSNSFYRCVATQSCVRVPQSTVCTVVNQVAKVIASRTSTYVKIPDLAEQDEIAQRVFEKHKIPGNFKDFIDKATSS